MSPFSPDYVSDLSKWKARLTRVDRRVATASSNIHQVAPRVVDVADEKRRRRVAVVTLIENLATDGNRLVVFEQNKTPGIFAKVTKNDLFKFNCWKLNRKILVVKMVWQRFHCRFSHHTKMFHCCDRFMFIIVLTNAKRHSLTRGKTKKDKYTRYDMQPFQITSIKSQ